MNQAGLFLSQDMRRPAIFLSQGRRGRLILSGYPAQPVRRDGLGRAHRSGQGSGVAFHGLELVAALIIAATVVRLPGGCRQHAAGSSAGSGTT